MRSLNSLLDEYAESHQNPFNQVIHKICVPAIMLSIIGLLWAIPQAPFMPALVNWSTITVSFIMVYYLVLSRKYFLLMAPVIALMYYVIFLVDGAGYVLSFSIIVFILSWVFQLWGHKVEGKKPSFLKDLLFLLIGPLWVLKALLRIKD